MTVPNMQQLLEAGVHFGHRVRRGNPKMGEFIYGARDGVHIIDLAKSEEKLQEAANFAHELGTQGGVLLLLGTKKQAKQIIHDLAALSEAPYLTERWLGGTLTNFDEIKKNIRKLTDLKDEKEKGTLSRYTKKEQLLIDRKLQKFDKELGGMAQMSKVPDAIFIIDTASDLTAVKEANRVGVKIIGFADTNSDPNYLDYPIPANDDGIKSIKLVCETIVNAYIEGKKKAGDLAEKKAAAEAKAIEAAKEEVAEVPDEIKVLEEVVENLEVADSERKVT